MSDDIGVAYQQAAKVVTQASFLLNLFRPSTGAADDPTSGLAISLVRGATVQQALIDQLKDSNVKVPSALKVSLKSTLPSILNATILPSFLTLVSGAVALPFKLIGDVITGTDPKQDLQTFQTNLESAVRSLAAPLAHLPFLLLNQIEVALSVLPTLQMLQKSSTAFDNIESALGAYFFSDGFTTIDGDKIALPQLTDVTTADLKTLKSLVSQKSGVEYLRNAVRIPLEAGTDTEYDLPNRLTNAPIQVFGNTPTADQKAKLIAWMKGFASQAESATTTAIEALVSGAGSAQTNALIAAAAGTAGGTLARKATQHVFLKELGM